MNRHEWNYDELDNILFKQSEAQIDCLRAVNRGFSPKKTTSRLGAIGQKIYKGDEGKFIKSLQECLNYEESSNDIADGYTSLMRIGYQPDLIHLSQLETIDEHVEWKNHKDNNLRHRQQLEKKQKQTQEAQHQKHLKWKKELEESKRQKTLTKEALELLSGSKDDEISQRNRRLITVDMASETASKQETENSQMSQFKLINLKKNRHGKDQYMLVEQKCECKDESPRMSERSEATANTSNFRSHYTPSPTKFRRDQENFSRAATNVMASINLTTEFSKEDFRSEQGTISPDVSHRGSFMPGQSLFDFRNKNVTARNITSAKGNRAFSPMKKYNPSQDNTQVNRMNSLMDKEYKTLTETMMKNN